MDQNSLQAACFALHSALYNSLVEVDTNLTQVICQISTQLASTKDSVRSLDSYVRHFYIFSSDELIEEPSDFYISACIALEYQNQVLENLETFHQQLVCLKQVVSFQISTSISTWHQVRADAGFNFN